MSALRIDRIVALSVLLDCSAEVHLWRHVQLHTVSGGVEDADVVSAVVGVLGALAALVVDSGGGAVEEVFGFLVTFS